MTADRLSQEEHVEARRKAQNIQKTINTAVDRRLVRCVAPLRFIRPRNVSSPDQAARYGIELRVDCIQPNCSGKNEGPPHVAQVLTPITGEVRLGAREKAGRDVPDCTPHKGGSFQPFDGLGRKATFSGFAESANWRTTGTNSGLMASAPYVLKWLSSR